MPALCEANAYQTPIFYLPASFRRYVDGGRVPHFQQQPDYALTSPLSLQPRLAQIPPPAGREELHPTAPGWNHAEQEPPNEPKSPWQRVARRSLDEILPRRNLREFSTYSRQFKRMRPCFYSPIQCLMRKRSSA